MPTPRDILECQIIVPQPESAASGDENSVPALPVELLAKASGLSRSSIKDAMAKGAVWLEKSLLQGNEKPGFSRPRRLRRVKSRLLPGDRLSLYYNRQVLAHSCAAPYLIADEGSYSVWDKPPGMLCQGSRWGDHTTLNRWFEKCHSPRQAYIVHRLDRMASGLVVLAHNKRSAAALSAQFCLRQTQKIYRVIVMGEVDFSNLPHCIDTELSGKQAITHILQAKPAVELLNQRFNLGIKEQGKAQLRNDSLEKNHCSELLLSIETGRKHQIRQHLADIGLPVLGDRLYGISVGDKNNELVDLQLRAEELSLVKPDTGIFYTYKLT